ncbi:MAG TPA: glycoside hydrolase family 3 C-terminal domain-containing protein [Arachnia sp.]|nr:glycoside hydrolase family 3 C-terminal domain-containing protein [Arachnia sp.]
MSQTRRRGAAISIAAALTLLSSAVVPAFDQLAVADGPDLAVCPWMDTTLSADARAQLVIDASSLGQKMRWLVEHPATRPNDTVFGGVVYPAALPCLPEIQFSDGPYGVQGANPATAFPAPIAEASIWDEEITYEKYATVSREAWGHRRTVHLAPGISGGRNPLAPRTSEYLGEDPVLAGVLAASGVRGLQEGNPGQPTMANIKHYVANEQRGPLERTSSSNMDERTLRQHYNLSFEIASKEGNPASAMCSYNAVNGVSVCQNPEVLDLLRDSGFNGFIMSDFNGIYSTAPSINAGLDMELNRPVYLTPANLQEALDDEEITEDQISTAAFNVVKSFISVGLFDAPRPSAVANEIITPQSIALAREMAERGTVLLKNDGVLPLADEPQTIAVIGRTASNTPTEGVSAISVCGAHQGRVNCSDNVAPLESITERAEAVGAEVVFYNGLEAEAAAEVASEADVAIVFGYSYTGYRDDYPNLNLLHNGDELISAVAAANDKTVAVLASGTAVEMPWLADVDAVLHTWYPGQQMGPALAGLLWGDVNPSGKLPMTFPKSFSDTPVALPERYPGIVDENGWLQVEYSEGLKVGYRWYESEGIEPLFAFGHGLSYTTFDYSQLQVTPKSTDGKKEIRVRFRVTNTGDVAGREISQVYLELPDVADEPAKRLIGWSNIELQPGQHRNVEVTLTADNLETRRLLQYWDEDSEQWTTPSGTYQVHVGRSSADVPLTTTLRVR